MEKGSGTRSGLLWEIERILSECDQKPQILLMENVPEVIGEKNIKHFAEWVKRLDEWGYYSKWEIINGTDFNMPQNRKRCFMVSVLGDYFYNFPNPIGCELRLEDLLEQNVDEKYYCTKEQIERIKSWNAQQDPLKNIDKEKVISPCITARGAGEEHSGMILINESLAMGTALNESDAQIRKLTPRECFRLMGVMDADFDKIAKNQSNSSLYHLAGDSIITNCLMAIFKEML